jgi:hypothetical protein
LILLKKELNKLNGFYVMMNSIMAKMQYYLINDIGIPKEEVYEQFTIEEQEKLIEALKENKKDRAIRRGTMPREKGNMGRPRG